MTSKTELFTQLNKSISEYDDFLKLNSKTCDCDPAIKSYLDNLYQKNLACLRDIQKILKTLA